MKKTVLLIALILLWAATARADWSITIQGPVTISGPGAAPVVITAPPVTPPPVVVPPPVVPPVVPPIKPPGRDTTPFVFPSDCPTRPIDSSDRTVWAWRFPGDYEDFYAYIDGTGNPLPMTHTCAGIFAPGAVSEPSPGYPQGRSLKDCKLWVPRSAGTARPWDIRCVLATGKVCP